MSGPSGFSIEALHAALTRLPRLADLSTNALELMPLKGVAHDHVRLRGRRLVAITFIESRIPDEFQRNQLYELSRIAQVEGPKMSWDHRVRLDVVRNNILRMWARS